MKEVNICDLETTLEDPNSLVISVIAEKTPAMEPKNFDAHLESIKLGQNVPIILYRNKVVDGRHRVKACILLNKKVLCARLPHKMTLNAVEVFVEKLEQRRDKTRAQKAIMAYNYKVANDVSGSEAAKKFGIYKQEISTVKSILSFKDGNELIAELFNGKTPELKTAEGKRIYTKQLNKILSILTDKEQAKFTDGKDKSTNIAIILKTLDSLIDASDRFKSDEWIASFEIKARDMKKGKINGIIVDDGDMPK